MYFCVYVCVDKWWIGKGFEDSGLSKWISFFLRFMILIYVLEYLWKYLFISFGIKNRIYVWNVVVKDKI